jgi:hypothetical protein
MALPNFRKRMSDALRIVGVGVLLGVLSLFGYLIVMPLYSLYFWTSDLRRHS